jgi:ribosome-associated toxin RatA of RatAB toxin-antitoxin module
MRTVNTITIRAPLATIFATASDLARWPDFLPHYRYNRFLSAMPWGGIVKMSAVRSGIPTTWNTASCISSTCGRRSTPREA